VKANSAICHCLTPLVQTNIPTTSDYSVHNTWEHLKETYYKSDVSAQFMLREQVASLRLWDAADAERYLGEFNTVMEQFATMGGSYSDADAISRPSMGSLMWEPG
jgi:hypothetical protein